MSEKISRKDRAKGAIMGSIIGDALGVGPHWYYDLEELKAEFGWVDNYIKYRGRQKYHDGMEAGLSSQTGQFIIMLLESVAESGEYNEDGFTKRVDELLSTLDGSPRSGRYTDAAIRDVWRERKAGVEWLNAGSLTDTPDAAIRTPVLSARYSKNPRQAYEHMITNIKLTHRDPQVVGQSLAFGMTVTMLIDGIHPSETDPYHIGSPSSKRYREWRRKHKVPGTYPVTGIEIPAHAGQSKSPASSFDYHDHLSALGYGYAAAHNPEITIEPASSICTIGGLSCRMCYLLPAAYYLVGRYTDDYEMAVLSAINGGGHNMARAGLTGGLSGALVGFSGIPERFVTGLVDHERLVDLADQVAEAAESNN
jgi:ADP-ribosylglycohydrolase